MSSRRSFCSNLVGQATAGCLDAPTPRTALSESAPLDNGGTSDAARTESPAGWCTPPVASTTGTYRTTRRASRQESPAANSCRVPGRSDSSRVSRFGRLAPTHRATARRRYGCTHRAPPLPPSRCRLCIRCICPANEARCEPRPRRSARTASIGHADTSTRSRPTPSELPASPRSCHTRRGSCA